jgi:hypothetical protein
MPAPQSPLSYKPPHIIPIINTHLSYNCPIPGPTFPSQAHKTKSSHLNPLKAIQLRSHIKVEIQLLPRPLLILPRVKINHILDFSPAPIDHPIVAVERRLVAQQRVEARARGERGGQAGKGG